MNQQNPLQSVFFITLPNNIAPSKMALPLDVSIPLPVQTYSAEINHENFDISTLSWEMIVAGILTVLAYDSKNIHVPYYRKIVLETKPAIKKELTEAAILKARNEDFDIAEEIFAALRGLDPEDSAILLNSALFFDQYGDYYRKSGLLDEANAYDGSANSFYTQVLESEPPIPDAFFNAGFFYLKQKQFSRARSLFETYIALMADLPQEQENESILYKIERASEIVKDIAERNLDDALFKAAFDSISNGEEEKGLAQVRQFLEKNQTVWNAWFLLGWGLRRLHRWNDARQAFEQALSCGGDNTDTYNELAICLIELSDFDQAKRKLFKALQLEPENTKVISNLGFLCLRMENPTEAQKYFLAVLEFDPDDVVAKQALKDLGCS